MTRRTAFTLVELTIVVAILALLVTILVPVIASMMGDTNKAKCASNLKVIANALHSYGHEHNGRFPSLESTHAYWHAVGHNNNVPNTLDIADGTRPLFMLMAVPNGNAARSVQYATPQAFVCPGVAGAVADPMAYDNQVGFTSYQNISYSYQHQLKVQSTGFSLGLLTAQDRVVLADKNPLTAYNGSTSTVGGTTYYRMDVTSAMHSAHSVNHGGGGGQNVLRAGGTVNWVSSSAVGPGNDNIWDPTNKTSGDFVRNELPQSANDVFLVP